MTMGQMSAFVVDTGVDDSKLGRWSWSLMGAAGNEEKKMTRVVVAYQPCKPGKNTKGTTVFEQQQRYFEARGDFCLPRTIFVEQLAA